MKVWGTYSVANNILFVFPDWEERALSGFARNLQDLYFDQIFVINYGDGLHLESTSANIDKIMKMSSDHHSEVRSIKLSKEHSISNWNVLANELTGISFEEKKIYMDITTMPREIIWMMLYNLKKWVKNIHYTYHQPECYSQDWLTREPDTPRLLFKHSGIIDPFKQTALLIVPGFDSERVSQLIGFFDPKKVLLGIQLGSQFSNHLRNNGKLHKIEADYEIVEIDGYSSDMGYSALEVCVSQHIEEYNIVVTSLGPKLTALSLYKLFQKHDEIALAYIPCKDFNLRYSAGIGETINGTFNFTD